MTPQGVCSGAERSRASAGSSSRPLTASTDEINAGCKARVERRKVSEGADEGRPPECQWEVRRERGRGVDGWVLVRITPFATKTYEFMARFSFMWRDFTSLLRDSINRATKKGCRGSVRKQLPVSYIPLRRSLRILLAWGSLHISLDPVPLLRFYDIAITERFLSGNISCIE